MSKPRRQTSPRPLVDRLLLKRRKPVPHGFVLDAIASSSPYTRPMFGCPAVYVKEKIEKIVVCRATTLDLFGKLRGQSVQVFISRDCIFRVFTVVLAFP
jgi:hypothetical protein